MLKKTYQLTPEQLALSEARKVKKLLKKAKQAEIPNPPVQLPSRPWIPLQSASRASEKHEESAKILTWNLLAQCLVRRDLFPTSDCLKTSQREPMLHHELLMHQADILCLQEVDRTDKLIPVLETADYSTCYVTGPGKKHGLLVAWKKGKYVQGEHRVVHYDSAEVRTDGDDTQRQAKTFKTRNIGLILALKSASKEANQFVVATTHLFWHPKYTYERTRQAGILLREVIRFKTENDLAQSPAFLCGDFNFTPDEPAYSLLIGDDLLPTQIDILQASHVIHSSIDPSISADARVADDDEETTDPDNTKASIRPATPEDRLLSLDELKEFFRQLPRLRSAYDEGVSSNPSIPREFDIFSDRGTLPSGRRGSFEPAYSSYTYYWQNMIDYLFILNPSTASPQISQLLAPHQTSNLAPGIPRLTMCGSDHVSLGAEIRWSTEH